MRCGSGCGDLMVISTRGGDGTQVTLRACGSCDARWWSRDGQLIDLRDLLVDLGRPPVLSQAS